MSYFTCLPSTYKQIYLSDSFCIQNIIKGKEKLNTRENIFLKFYFYLFLMAKNKIAY